MFTEYLVTVFYSNKAFQNPILGKLSCQVFKESFYECKKHHAFKSKEEACSDLKFLMKECYSANKPQQINKLIMEEFKQAYNTAHFFQERRSILTQRLFSNYWGIFFNRVNLKKYQKFINKSNQHQSLQGIL